MGGSQTAPTKTVGFVGAHVGWAAGGDMAPPLPYFRRKAKRAVRPESF